MADAGARSLAEKLAAAKKKHKAYLKEKGLKITSNKIKGLDYEELKNDTPNNNEDVHTEQGLELPGANTEINNTASSDSTNSGPYEADLPLPQYSMDYNKDIRSSLPDPLSFFDNLSNVGATFQNFTQPITSLFNNNSNGTEDNSLVDQILVDDSLCAVNTSDNSINYNNVSSLQTEYFSYDKFKNNAINSVSTNVPKNEEVVSNVNIIEEQNYPIFDQFTNSSNSLSNVQKPEMENSSNPFHNIPTSDISCKTDLEYVQNNIANKNLESNVPVVFEINPEVVAYTSSTESQDIISHLNNAEVQKNEINEVSNLQTLLRISNEMEDLIKKEEKLSAFTSVESLEKRNHELVTLLEQHNTKCQQLSTSLNQSELKYTNLLTEYKMLELHKEAKEADLILPTENEMQSDVMKLREDLQCHLQTIGLLVAEKTELSNLLHESQTTLKGEISKNTGLQNDLKNLKLFYSNLEHELGMLKSEKINLNSSQKEQTDMFNTMCDEYNKMKRQNEELTQDILESKEKLKSVTESNVNLHKQVQELNGLLSLANIKIQQLTLGESNQDSQVDKLIEEKLAYEKQISALNESIKIITKEREESNLQYHQYAQQLSDQITNSTIKLEEQQKENEQLKVQEAHRIRHIGELEKQLQNIQNDGSTFNLQKNNISLKKELEISVELAKNLQVEKDELNISFTKALVDKELLEKELEGCKYSVSQLESSVEQLRGSQPDNAILLATMESDKVAASRAISQNNEMKKQMEGMQEVLLKVNNDNVQLTENMSLERRTNKELLEKLQKTEISFQTLAEAIEIKDKELLNLRDQLENINKEIIQQEQLSDRLRHYEACDHSSPSLQNELQDAKQMIAHLTNELNIMKRNQLNQTSQMNQTNQIDLTNQNTQTNSYEVVDHEESEHPDAYTDLRMQVRNLQIRNNELESLLQNVNTTQQRSTDTNGNEKLDKETAMMHLEKKFLKTMEEIAKLTEEKQRLEHLVLQLQGETETIGEYVTLYQQQRSILKQRALEKDQQLRQLTNDRETIKANLDRLNNLVNKLIVEKGAITKELLEQHEHFSRERDDLCAEHQKIHQEINKITSDGLKNSNVSDNTNTEIAEEIINLLSEIKTSNLVQPSEGIHHCPWCSGKLITV